jgi:hypothetical protein
VNRVTQMWVISGIVVVCSAAIILQSSIFDGADTTGVSIREYGSLDSELQGSTTGAAGVAGEDAATAAADLDFPNGQEGENGGSGEAPLTGEAMAESERDSMNYEEADQAAGLYRISARTPRDFDRERLSGFSEAEIDEIALGMRDYAQWLQDSSGGDVPAPTIKLTPEEREVRRETREAFLSDDEYDAALYATGQKNAAVFANLKRGSEAWDTGVRTGDVLESINGVPIFDLMDFVDGRDQIADGEMHVLVVVQAGQETTIRVSCCRPGWGPVDMITHPPLSFRNHGITPAHPTTKLGTVP